MWEVVRTETGRSRRFQDYTEILKRPNGTIFSSKSEAVDAVNVHFVNVATSCGAPAADVAAATSALATARPPADVSLRLKPFTALEVFRATHGVAHKKSKDAYDISISLLLSIAESLAHVLSLLFNKCIRKGVYPPSLKFVKVSPLYKGKGQQEEINS